MNKEDQNRAEFELIASDYGQFPHAIERDEKGHYLLIATAIGWTWWQAARQTPPLISNKPALPPQEDCSGKNTDTSETLQTMLSIGVEAPIISHEERVELNKIMAEIFSETVPTQIINHKHITTEFLKKWHVQTRPELNL